MKIRTTYKLCFSIIVMFYHTDYDMRARPDKENNFTRFESGFSKVKIPNSFFPQKFMYFDI